MPAFAEYFFEQELWRTFVFLVLAAAIYAAVVAAALTLFRRRLGLSTVRAIVVASGIALLAAAVGITLFETSALWFRSVPHGSGHQRQGESLDEFYRWAEVAFFSLYAFLVLLGGSFGFAFGKLRAAAVTAVVVAAFLALTLPVVEFENACNVGRPMVTDEYIEC